MIDTLIIVAAIGAVACGIVYFWARSARIEAEEQARRELARRELRQSRLDDLIRKPSTTNVSSSTTTTYTSTPSRAVPVRDDSDELATAMLVNQMMNNMVQPVYIDASPTYVVQEVPVASTYSAPEPAPIPRRWSRRPRPVPAGRRPARAWHPDRI